MQPQSIVAITGFALIVLGVFVTPPSTKLKQSQTWKRVGLASFFLGVILLSIALGWAITVGSFGYATYKLASPTPPTNINVAFYAFLALAGIITMIISAPEIAKPNHKRQHEVAVVVGFFMTAAGLFFAFLGQ